MADDGVHADQSRPPFVRYSVVPCPAVDALARVETVDVAATTRTKSHPNAPPRHKHESDPADFLLNDLETDVKSVFVCLLTITHRLLVILRYSCHVILGASEEVSVKKSAACF